MCSNPPGRQPTPSEDKARPRLTRSYLLMSVVARTDSCQDLTLLSDNDDSSESEQNSDTSDEKMDIDKDDGFLPGNDEDEHMCNHTQIV